jgi:predicted lipase
MTTTDLTERRELAQRTNDGIDVTLFWSKASNRVTISVLHTRSATALEFDVDGADALDAFNHPYAYAATSGARHIATPHRVMNP